MSFSFQREGTLSKALLDSMVGNPGLSNSQTLNTVSKMRKTKQDLVMMVGQLDFNYIVPLAGLELSIEWSGAMQLCFVFVFVFILSPILFALNFCNRSYGACCSQTGQIRHRKRIVGVHRAA